MSESVGSYFQTWFAEPREDALGVRIDYEGRYADRVKHDHFSGLRTDAVHGQQFAS